MWGNIHSKREEFVSNKVFASDRKSEKQANDPVHLGAIDLISNFLYKCTELEHSELEDSDSLVYEYCQNVQH